MESNHTSARMTAPICHRQGFGISRDGPYLFPRSDTGCIGTGIDGTTFISNRFPASNNGRIRIIFHCSTFRREMKAPVVFHMPVHGCISHACSVGASLGFSPAPGYSCGTHSSEPAQAIQPIPAGFRGRNSEGEEEKRSIPAH